MDDLLANIENKAMKLLFSAFFTLLLLGFANNSSAADTYDIRFGRRDRSPSILPQQIRGRYEALINLVKVGYPARNALILLIAPGEFARSQWSTPAISRNSDPAMCECK